MKRLLANKRQVISLLLLLGCLALIGCIFGNSLKTATVSSEQSDKVVEIVRPIAEPILDSVHITPTDSILSFLVRKTAHFSEFALLGFLAFLCVRVYPSEKKTRLFLTLPFCALIACADEGIQLLIEGRSGQLSDVLLDICGSLCGILFAAACTLFALFLYRKRKINRQHLAKKKKT